MGTVTLINGFRAQVDEIIEYQRNSWHHVCLNPPTDAARFPLIPKGETCPHCFMDEEDQRRRALEHYTKMADVSNTMNTTTVAQSDGAIMFDPIPTLAEQTVYYFMYGRRWFQGV